HATSDTCTMDDEESVLGFTEERALITLGRVRFFLLYSRFVAPRRYYFPQIHTHPTQSCFTSSVDLHTHASFQRMLPSRSRSSAIPSAFHSPKFTPRLP
ncbi:hypothetical protein DFH09DRAFT_1207374, partial [Mycena vulgaris]